MIAPRAPRPGAFAQRVPLVMEMAKGEGAAACLSMVLAYWGTWLPLGRIRVACGPSRDGTRLDALVRAARDFDLEAAPERLDVAELRRRGRFPAIVGWEGVSYAVVRGFRGGSVWVYDPARGVLVLDEERFSRLYDGRCLFLAPGPDFRPEGRRPSIFRFALSRMRHSTSLLVFVVIALALVSYLAIVNPALSQIFIDHLLTGQSPQWEGPFYAILVTLCAVEVAAEVLSTTYSTKLEGKLTGVALATYCWKVLHLPASFFDERGIADLNLRGDDQRTVMEGVVSTFTPLAINALSLVVYLVVMFAYSWPLALIGASSVVANLYLSYRIVSTRVDIGRVRARDTAALEDATVSGISLIESLKATGSELGFFQQWAGYHASLNHQAARYGATGAKLEIIPDTLSMVSNAAVLVVGLWLVFAGDFTIGMILAFQGYLTGFAAPADKLRDSLQLLQEMRSDIERIDDVLDSPADPLATHGREDWGAGEGDRPLAKLRGGIDLEHVTFGYSPQEPPVIEDLSLSIEPGTSVGLVGSSGSGKSTVAKLLSGLYLPWEGSIRLDGVELAEVPRDVRCGSLAVVDQDIVLFADTVTANITLWDESIEDYEVVMAARDACIHEDIIARPGGYDHRLAPGGRDLSGGERQRLEIARALAQDPTILVLDEGTSALDTTMERAVLRAIRRRGATTLVISHRLSAVRDCDEIVVLEHGSIVERGTHDELIARGGRYAALAEAE